MKYKFLQKTADYSKLIIYFNGYGMEDNFLREVEIPEDCTLLICYDYTDFMQQKAEFLAEVNKFAEINIIAWSLGVTVANELFADFDKTRINKSIAINATLDVLSNEKGIGEDVFVGTIKNWDIEVARNKFFIRVANSRANFNLLNMPKNRDVQSQKSELTYLYNFYHENKLNNYIFKRVYVGLLDKIFLANNQLAYWNEIKDIEIVTLENCGHYPFFELTLKELMQ